MLSVLDKDVCEAVAQEVKSVFDPANFVQCGVDTKSAFDAFKNIILKGE